MDIKYQIGAVVGVFIFAGVIAGVSIWNLDTENNTSDALNYSAIMDLIRVTGTSGDWMLINATPDKAGFIKYSKMCGYDYIFVNSDTSSFGQYCGKQLVFKRQAYLTKEKLYYNILTKPKDVNCKSKTATRCYVDNVYDPQDIKSTKVSLDSSEVNKLKLVLNVPFYDDTDVNYTMEVNKTHWWVFMDSDSPGSLKRQLGIKDVYVSGMDKFVKEDPDFILYDLNENVSLYGGKSGKQRIDPGGEFPGFDDCLEYRPELSKEHGRMYQEFWTVYFYNETKCGGFIADWNKTSINDTSKVRNVRYWINYFNDYELQNVSVYTPFNGTHDYGNGTVINVTGINGTVEEQNVSISWIEISDHSEINYADDFYYKVSALVIDSGFLDDEVCIISNITGVEICDDHHTWNSSQFNTTAVANVTGHVMPINDSQTILYLKACNCSANYTCDSSQDNNASCFVNFCTEKLNASEDCSDIDVYNSVTNTTLSWIPLVNVTGASWLGNQTGLTDDALYWDAILITDYEQSGQGNSSPVQVSATSVKTGSTNEGDLQINAFYAYDSNLGDTPTIDWSGNDYNSINNGATFKTDNGDIYGSNQSNGYYFFDGGNDYINTTYGVGSQLTIPFSISLWFTASSLSDVDTLYGALDSGSDSFILLREEFGQADSQLEFVLRDDDAAVITAFGNWTINTSTWYHCVVTLNSSHLSFYYNGQLMQRVSNTLTGTFALDFDIYMGYNSGFNPQNYWHGNIDNVIFYNYSLTDSEVEGLYEEGKHNQIASDVYTSSSLAVAPCLPYNNFTFSCLLETLFRNDTTVCTVVSYCTNQCPAGQNETVNCSGNVYLNDTGGVLTNTSISGGTYIVGTDNYTLTSYANGTTHSPDFNFTLFRGGGAADETLPTTATDDTNISNIVNIDYNKWLVTGDPVTVSGSPKENVIVSLHFMSNQSQYMNATTDSAGNWNISAENGTYLAYAFLTNASAAPDIEQNITVP